MGVLTRLARRIGEAGGIARASVLALLGMTSAYAATPMEVPAELAHLFEPGCSETVPLHGGDPRQLRQLPLSTSSFRLAIVPDSYRGDGAFIATIDTGTHRATGAERKAFLQFSIGSLAGTCTVRMPLHACPQAQDVRDSLKGLQIPVGLGVDEGEFLALHPTIYALEFTNGDHSHNQLTYHGRFNPIEETLDAAREALRPCWQSAADQHTTLREKKQREGRPK